MQTHNNKKNISITNLMSEAWDIRQGLQMPIFIRLAFCAGILIPVFLLDSYLINNMTDFMLLNCFLVLGHLVLKIITVMINIRIATIPCIMLAVRQSIGLDISIEKTIDDINIMQPALDELTFKTAIYITVFTTIAHAFGSYGSDSLILLSLLLLFTCYLLLIPLYIFAIPLIVMQKMDFIPALNNAYDKAKIYWPQILGMYAAYYCLLAAAIGLLLIVLSMLHTLFCVYFLNFILMIILIVWLSKYYMSFIVLSFTMSAILFRDVYDIQIITPTITTTTYKPANNLLAIPDAPTPNKPTDTPQDNPPPSSSI